MMRGRPYRPRRTLGERLYSFMIGRNGTDALGRALLVLYLLLFAANLVLSYTLHNPTLNYVLNWVQLSLMIYSIFRMFSRNLPARRRENAWYLRRAGAVKGFFKLRRNKWRDRKTHVFRKCPQCKSVLRLPRQKGKHTVRCPRCQHRFDVKI